MVPEDKVIGEEVLASEIDTLRNIGYSPDINAGETINGATLPVAVFPSSADGELYACDANDQAKLEFIGFAISNSTDGNPIQLQESGFVGGFTGLTNAAKYYVQDDKTIGTAVGTYEIYIGKAVGTTKILIDKGPTSAMQYMGSASFSEDSASTTAWSGTLTAPTGWRFAVVNIAGAANPISFEDAGKIIMVLGNVNADNQVYGGAAQTNTRWAITFSGSTFTLSVSSDTQNSSWSCSGTLYFYR
jgi:hypothetical protein